MSIGEKKKQKKTEMGSWSSHKNPCMTQWINFSVMCMLGIQWELSSSCLNVMHAWNLIMHVNHCLGA